MNLLEFLEFFNQNSGAVTALFTVGLTIVTLIYACLTWGISKETKMMRKAQTEPNISATIQAEEGNINLIDLIIKNIGLGPAYNVKFEANPDFESRFCKLSEIGFIKNGLPYFAPNQEFQIFLANLIENFEEILKKTFEIKITYESNLHESYSNTYLIDFSQRIGSSLTQPPLYEIADNIKQIQSDINKISTGSTKLNVIIYTKEDIDEERKRRSERFKQ
ncbi:MAG: hypothetical protein ACYDHX_04930 [Methanothrix sp.]